MPRHHAPFDPAFIQSVNEHQFGLGDTPGLPARCPNCSEGGHRAVFDTPGLLVADTDGLRCLECGHLDPAPAFPQSVLDDDRRVRWAQVLYRNRTATISALIESLLAHPCMGSQASDVERDCAPPTMSAIRLALGSLRRYALLCEGIETRPGRPFEITSDWASVRDCCPPPGWAFDTLCHRDGETDPHHPAFGVGWHIVRLDGSEPANKHGRAHYWRYVA